jgi:antitoxin VapB
MTSREDDAMNLQIRDKRAYELARRLAEKRNTSMTDAVIAALENELGREKPRPLSVQFAELAKELKDLSPGGGRRMTKDEIDEMWGHE